MLADRRTRLAAKTGEALAAPFRVEERSENELLEDCTLPRRGGRLTAGRMFAGDTPSSSGHDCGGEPRTASNSASFWCGDSARWRSCSFRMIHSSHRKRFEKTGSPLQI